MKLADIAGKAQHRELSISSREVDAKERRVTIAFSSEEPYQRWWGTEILDHAPASIRLDRLRDGGPLLVGHDVRDHIGVVESVRVGADRVARATVRFGRSARAEEILQDVADGIRVKASVAYQIHDLQLEREEDGVQTFRVNDWEPLEISLVAVPADNTVGVGRSIANINEKGKGKGMDNEEQDQLPALSRRERAAARDTDTSAADGKRIAELFAAGANYKDLGGLEVAQQLAGMPGGNIDMFKGMMLERIRTKTPQTEVASGFGGSFERGAFAETERMRYGEGARNIVSSGRLRVFRGKDGERKAYAFSQFLRSQLPGQDVAVRWCRENGFQMQRYINSGTGSEGGYLVPEELASELIRNRDSTYNVARSEARVWPMKSDSLSVPTSSSGISASFVANDTETTAVTPSFGQVNLATKQVMAVVNIERQTMDDAAVDVADHVAFEMVSAFGKIEDQCLFIGDGTSTYGGMTGLSAALAAGSKYTAASNHDTTAEIDVTDLAGVMALLPQYAQGNAKWYMSMAFYGAMLQRLLLVAGGNTAKTLEQGAGSNPMFAGFPVVLSPILPSDTTADYSSTIMAYFGDLRRASAFGDREKISLMLDPYTLAGKAQVRILAYERFQVVNHGVGTASAAGPIVALVGQ